MICLLLLIVGLTAYHVRDAVRERRVRLCNEGYARVALALREVGVGINDMGEAAERMTEHAKAAADGFRKGIERAETADDEAFDRFCEARSKNYIHYETEMEFLRVVGLSEDEIPSYEQWAERTRNLPANIKWMNGLAKQALKDMGVSGE